MMPERLISETRGYAEVRIPGDHVVVVPEGQALQLYQAEDGSGRLMLGDICVAVYQPPLASP